MENVLPKDLQQPSVEENFLQNSERSDRLNELLIEELNARDLINKESQERIDNFLQSAQSEVNFDPSYIEFFSEGQERIELLNNRYQRLLNGEMPREEEIEELNRRIDASTSFFTGINETLSSKLSNIEIQTNALIRQLPNLITTYENELLRNRELKKKLEDLKKQKQNP